ncbi:uncharacterized protein LY79DRAFT_669679 [Colletotrichum navitas]|uniref:Uncharacterized protein n=1 Tax=Colletotrichum navitas TaxID=681940 RepID=A0AAD8PZA7_9PEZI|nr:uncharacterized protein LY79DRAFT_669679 [Colletotrichum navitas]KAK1590696.1 hypothetical protein LY79DRAFT_669679 [Colletotrichum navitas]
MQAGTHTGKLVLESCDDDVVTVEPSRKASYPFAPDVTCVLTPSRGPPGVAVDLGMILPVGFAAENKKSMANLGEGSSLKGLTELEATRSSFVDFTQDKEVTGRLRNSVPKIGDQEV